MIVSLGKWWARAKFIVVFAVLTIVLYNVLQAVGGWITPMQRYKEPAGKAVKVFQHEEPVMELDTMLDRLLFFYRYGE